MFAARCLQSSSSKEHAQIYIAFSCPDWNTSNSISENVGVTTHVVVVVNEGSELKFDGGGGCFSLPPIISWLVSPNNL